MRKWKATLTCRNFAVCRDSRFDLTGAKITFTDDFVNPSRVFSEVLLYTDNCEGCTIANSIGTHTIQAKLISKDGEVLAESGIETIVAKSGFFSIIIAFFKALFGLLPVIEQ